MNQKLHDISLIILIIGIISLISTIFIPISIPINIDIEDPINTNMRRRHPDIYDYKVSEAYKKMFSQPSIWIGYQDFDPRDFTDKIYVK